MLQPVEISFAIQNIFDLWTSIEEHQSAYDLLPIIADAYRDADLNWEADFCQWLHLNRRRPASFGKLFAFSIDNKIKPSYLTPQQVIQMQRLKEASGEKTKNSLPSHCLPHHFLLLASSIVADTDPQCYYKLISSFSDLGALRQLVLDMDCT